MQTLLKPLVIFSFSVLTMFLFRPANPTPAPIALPTPPLKNTYLPLLINQTSDITVTLVYYSDEQYGTYHQQNYTFALEASSIISRQNLVMLAIKNDYQKQQSSFTFVTQNKLTTPAQMSQMVKLHEMANQLIRQYVKFELE